MVVAAAVAAAGSRAGLQPAHHVRFVATCLCIGTTSSSTGASMQHRHPGRLLCLLPHGASWNSRGNTGSDAACSHLTAIHILSGVL